MVVALPVVLVLVVDVVAPATVDVVAPAAVGVVTPPAAVVVDPSRASFSAPVGGADRTVCVIVDDEPALDADASVDTAGGADVETASGWLPHPLQTTPRRNTTTTIAPSGIVRNERERLEPTPILLLVRGAMPTVFHHPTIASCTRTSDTANVSRL